MPKSSKRVLKSLNLCVSSHLDIASLVHRYFHFRKAGVKFCHCYFPNPLRANDYASSATDSIRYMATLNEIKEFCSFIEKCSQKQQIHFSTKAKYWHSCNWPVPAFQNVIHSCRPLSFIEKQTMFWHVNWWDICNQNCHGCFGLLTFLVIFLTTIQS